MTVDPLNSGRFISTAAATATALAVLELSELLQRFLLAAIRSPRLTPSPPSPSQLFLQGALGIVSLRGPSENLRFKPVIASLTFRLLCLFKTTSLCYTWPRLPCDVRLANKEFLHCAFAKLPHPVRQLFGHSFHFQQISLRVALLHSLHE